MKIIRHALGLSALLLAAGCGCTEDSFQTFTLAPQRLPGFRAGVRIKPIEVPPVQPAKAKIDILFMLDDSSSFQNGFLAGDGRVKSAVAQEVMRQIEQQLGADLAADARTTGRAYDLAFGVARYEDFGGDFRAPVPNADATARPFILQMPLYRKDRDGFAARFVDALDDPAPGRGDILPTAVNPFFRSDAATGAEALFQAATGQGLDGNNNGSTGDSGAPAIKGTAGVPGSGYADPGSSGDVPAVAYSAAGNDEDGEPAFTATNGGAPASGNVGGAGWRPDSIRFIVLASDFATVAPFDTANPGNLIGKNGTSVAASAFRSAPIGFVDPRFGDAATVAPAGRATVQAAIDALLAEDIEVLSIGTQATANRGGKPNQPGDPLGNVYPAGPIAAIPTPIAPDGGPFTWMSAVAILTGTLDVVEPGEVGAAADMPLVYNLLTLYPTGAAQPTIDVREDLVDRIAQRVGPLPPPPGPLTDLIVDVSMTVTSAGPSAYVFTADGSVEGLSTTSTKTSVAIPRYYAGTPAPADVVLRWLVQAAPQTPDELNDVIGSGDLAFSVSQVVGGFTAPTAKVALTTFKAQDPTPAAVANLSQVVAVPGGCFYFEPVDTDSNVAAQEYCANFP